MMSVAEESHQTMKALALARAREAATNALLYASAPTPGHRGFDYAQAPTESGLHKVRPAFVCCYGHQRERRPSVLGCLQRLGSLSGAVDTMKRAFAPPPHGAQDKAVSEPEPKTWRRPSLLGVETI